MFERLKLKLKLPRKIKSEQNIFTSRNLPLASNPRPRIKALTSLASLASDSASNSGKLLVFRLSLSPLLLSSSRFLDCQITGVGGLCWKFGDFEPKFDQVVSLPGLSKLLSNRPQDPEVGSEMKYHTV